MLALASAACNGVELSGPADPATPLVDPADRAVHLEITGCGLAADRTGSGVAVGDRLVLTVAHVVAKADGIVASLGGEPTGTADIIAVDLARDLALLLLDSGNLPAVEFANLDSAASGEIVGAAASGTVPFRVDDAVRITTKEILGDAEHLRVGYRLDAATTTGDSGAGAYDAAGRLVGVVFATSVDEPTTWATASVEIEPFLETHHNDTAPIRCDPEASRLSLP